jgi:hypothetical protein
MLGPRDMDRTDTPAHRTERTGAKQIRRSFHAQPPAGIRW